MYQLISTPYLWKLSISVFPGSVSVKSSASHSCPDFVGTPTSNSGSFRGASGAHMSSSKKASDPSTSEPLRELFVVNVYSQAHLGQVRTFALSEALGRSGRNRWRLRTKFVFCQMPCLYPTASSRVLELMYSLQEHAELRGCMYSI